MCSPFAAAAAAVAAGGGGREPQFSFRWAGKEERRITSVSNPLVKHCVRLRLSSSYRRSSRSLLLVGLTPILEILRFWKLKDRESSIVDCLFLLDGGEASGGLDDYSNSVVYTNPTVMKKLSGMQSVDSTEAIAVMKMPKSFYDLESDREEMAFLSSFNSPYRILVLDGIQDPGNLGTLIRTACAFNWDGIYLLPGCCDPFNEKALRAARGASFQLPIVSGNWSHLMTLKTEFDMKILAGHPENNDDGSKSISLLSQELADTFAGKSLCLVLGSEGNGLSKETLENCDLVSIPMEGMFESLNVSVAGGIFLFMLQPVHER
uniref:tRNA/rRNA methyltransferase SpoU type domain-containing protein n=1 Tax=Ananas comosus var. bracteatus TaxID=296719 RepID=A0A6V7QG04_ANACO|nr:unnamed protein product [Ananas comosus var. bracteatus]